MKAEILKRAYDELMTLHNAINRPGSIHFYNQVTELGRINWKRYLDLMCDIEQELKNPTCY